jgi:hypothetical protein
MAAAATENSGCDWSPRRAPSPLALLPPGVEREHIAKFAGAAELHLIRLLSKRHLLHIAVDRHWQVLCNKLWTDKPGFGGRRLPLWGVFAQGEMALADRALQSSSETQASFVRVSLSEPRTHDLAPHETSRRLTWRESYDGSLKDATRTEITAQELERWPWLNRNEPWARRGEAHALVFEGRGLRHGGDVLFARLRPGLYARHAWTRAAPASLMLHGLHLSPGGSGTLRVERLENWAWRLRHMYWAWDAAPGAALPRALPGAWRRDARLGVE